MVVALHRRRFAVDVVSGGVGTRGGADVSRLAGRGGDAIGSSTGFRASGPGLQKGEQRKEDGDDDQAHNHTEDRW